MGVGIKYGYPKAPLPRKLKAYAMLLRPFTLLAPSLAGIFGVVVGAGSLTYEVLKTGVYVGVTLALAQAVGQVINQVVDAELDKVIKPYRPIPRGWVSRDEAMGLAWLLAVVAVARAFTVTVTFGLWVLVMLFFAVFYSLPPISPRRVNPFLNLLWVSFSRGFIPFIATVTVYGPLSKALLYSLIAWLWCFSLQGTKDVPDAEGDRMFGIKTVYNTYGMKGLVITSLTGLGLLTILSLASGHVLFLALIPLGVASLATIRREFITENTLGWALFYVGLGLTYLLAIIDSLPVAPRLEPFIDFLG